MFFSQETVDEEPHPNHTHIQSNKDEDKVVAMVNGEVDGVEEVAMVNGGKEVAVVNGGEEVAMVNGDAPNKSRWSFPPELEDFDLVSTDIDPAELELLFSDDRWALIRPSDSTVEPSSPEEVSLLVRCPYSCGVYTSSWIRGVLPL